mmetsp:Transcript_15330/g.15216  ORF Transcript_15330/g.15216 Transcript_15330/m.15216 type:complete len:82 (-) Transcript_15330:603-848(-)
MISAYFTSPGVVPEGYQHPNRDQKASQAKATHLKEDKKYIDLEQDSEVSDDKELSQISGGQEEGSSTPQKELNKETNDSSR